MLRNRETLSPPQSAESGCREILSADQAHPSLRNLAQPFLPIARRGLAVIYQDVVPGGIARLMGGA